MLTLKKGQLESFDEMEWQRFRGELATHLETYFPWCACVWPDGKADALADFGCARARHWGFETERQITMFVTPMPVLGARYDENPLLLWASDKLNDPMIREPVHRCDQLNDRAMLHLRKTNGKKGEKALRGLRRVHAALSERAVPQDAPRALMNAFPDRARASDQTRPVLDKAVERARGFGMTTDMDGFLFVGMTLFFGPYFYADPQLPEINAAVTDKALPPEEKTEVLRSVALRLLNALGEHVGEGR